MASNNEEGGAPRRPARKWQVSVFGDMGGPIFVGEVEIAGAWIDAHTEAEYRAKSREIAGALSKSFAEIVRNHRDIGVLTRVHREE